MQGVHASRYWLSRHITTRQNQNLHRAKIIWYSWFCQKISPDQATITQKKPSPEEVASVAKYFDSSDEHTNSDRNCFDCHRIIQPVANYFGKLSLDGKTFLASKLAAFDRPGGYWQSDSEQEFGGYFSDLGKQPGMEGLAELLINLPRVHKCVVNSTWENFFGSKYAMTAADSETAIKAFKGSGFNYRTLITHLLTKEEAIQYFTEGHQVFYDMVEKKKMTCETARNTAQLSVQEIITSSCVSCHEDGKDYFFDKDGDITATDADLLQRFYEVIDNGYMPFNSDYVLLDNYSKEKTAESNDIQKKILTCHLNEQAEAAGITLLGVDSSQDLNSMGHTGDGT